jgi:hypothetical protein
MHLVAAWTSLGTFDLLRLLGIAAVMVAALLPGRGVTRAAALALALATALLGELAAPWFVRAGWPIVWLLVAWRAGAPDGTRRTALASRRVTFETGLLALTLGLAFASLLLVAASRQALPAADARLTSLGAMVIGLGFLQLMLRRRVRRGLFAFAGLGLGLELLATAARSVDALHAGPAPGVALAATLVALGLTQRVAGSRERFAGSPFVSDAHGLHD